MVVGHSSPLLTVLIVIILSLLISMHLPVTVDEEVGAEPMLMRIKSEVKTESPDFAAGDEEGGENDDAEPEEETGGCSRTMARMPEASFLKWHQRKQQQRREEQSQVIQSASLSFSSPPSSSSFSLSSSSSTSYSLSSCSVLTTVDSSPTSFSPPSLQLPTPPPPSTPPRPKSATTTETTLASADLDRVSPVPQRKTMNRLIHPKSKHQPISTLAASVTTNSAANTIPVGIAVARQRREKCRSDSPVPLVQPKAKRPTAQSSPISTLSYQLPTDRLCMSTPSATEMEMEMGASGDSQFFSSSSPLGGLPLNTNYPAGRSIYNSAALYAGHSASAATANWVWSNPADYNAATAAVAATSSSSSSSSLWPTTDMNSIMGYPTYPSIQPASNFSSALLHHHHHPAGGLTTPPFLLIPAACLGKNVHLAHFLSMKLHNLCRI